MITRKRQRAVDMAIDPELIEHEIDYDLEKFAGFFIGGVRITVIVRDPNIPKAILMYGDDLAMKTWLETALELEDEEKNPKSQEV